MVNTNYPEPITTVIVRFKNGRAAPAFVDYDSIWHELRPRPIAHNNNELNEDFIDKWVYWDDFFEENGNLIDKDYHNEKCDLNRILGLIP